MASLKETLKYTPKGVKVAYAVAIIGAAAIVGAACYITNEVILDSVASRTSSYLAYHCSKTVADSLRNN